MCNRDQTEPFIAPGFDDNLHDCSFCNDTGISQETAGYCTACRMGKRIKQLDQFAEQLKGHGFTEAMRIVYRTTQRTEKAIAAADKALMMAHQQAQVAKYEWQPIETAPMNKEILLCGTDGFAVGYNGSFRVEPSGVFATYDGCGGVAFEIGTITHWMPLPASPVSKQG